MDETLNVGPCADALTLQALLDDELAPAAVESVLHHAERCPRCVQVLDELRATRNRSAEALCLEDEADLSWAASALARAKAAIDTTVGGRAPRRIRWFGHWRVAALVATTALLILAVPALVPTDAGASAERIARESVLRERAWMSRPNTVRHWTIESEIRNRRGVRDGRYRREIWQRNDASGGSARLSRQFDADNRLISASWVREDGSMVSWVAERPDEIRIRPSTAALHAALPSLPDHLRRALAGYLGRRRQSSTLQSQEQSFADYLTRASGLAASTGTFERVQTGSGGQDLYCVRSDVAFPEPYRPLVRLKQEDFIGARDFRRYRTRTWRYFADGVVETEDAQTIYFEETPFTEFDRHTLRDVMARAATVVELTAADLALEQVEREKYPPATPWMDPVHRSETHTPPRTPAAAVESAVAPQRPSGASVLRPGDRATLTIRWVVEDGYYLDEKTTSSLAFTASAGIAIAPRKVATSGRIIGVWEQAASVTIARNVPPGVHPVKVDAVIYFCSLRAQWCKRVTRTVQFPIDVSTKAAPGRKALDLEVPVPLDDER